MNAHALVYLAREREASYVFFKAHYAVEPGLPYDLLLVAKGEQAKKWCYNPDIVVSDYGLSLRAFSKAIKEFSHRYDTMTFLNSFSRPLVYGWMDRLVRVACHPKTGLAGCTGSWESFGGPLFPPFPNPHVRLNAFCARTEVLRKVWPRWLYGAKWMEHLHESGWCSITRKCKRLGLENIVVSRFITQKIEECNLFPIFRGNQDRLLVSDNQTREYEFSTAPVRARLRQLAWGAA